MKQIAPKSTTSEKLNILKDNGVTRCSMGVQSMSKHVLTTNGRIHTPEHVLTTYPEIRAAGFDCINLDLISGLPEQTDETFFISLELLLALSPDSITIYPLEIPEYTPLFQKLIRNKQPSLHPSSWTTRRQRLDMGFRRLEDKGYSRISAYTAVRDTHRHQFRYQKLQYHGCNMIGIGASSFSYVNGVHQQNNASLADYLTAVEDGRLPLDRSYELTPLEQATREFLLKLKLGHSDLTPMLTRMTPEEHAQFSKQLQPHINSGSLTRQGSILTVSPIGLTQVDSILPQLYPASLKNTRYN